MDWNAIGAIGEVLGAIAVIITVLYLAAQIRENTKQTSLQLDALDQSLVNNAHQAFSRFRALVLSSPGYPLIWSKALERIDDLSPDELVVSDMLFQEFIACYQLMYMAIDVERSEQNRGVTDLQEYFSLIGKNEFKKPGAKYMWDKVRHRFEIDDFADIIDKVISVETVT